jgi:hypothetical protein
MSTHNCIRVFYVMIKCCPPIRSGVTLFRDGSMGDTGDLLPSWWESPCRCNYAPDWFQRHLHKCDMMTLDLPRSLSQGSFITFSLLFFLNVCHYFRTYSSSPFLFIFSYPIPSNRISTHPAERSALGPEFGYHDSLSDRYPRQIPERCFIFRRRQGFLPYPLHFTKHSNTLRCTRNEPNIQQFVLN